MQGGFYYGSDHFFLGDDFFLAGRLISSGVTTGGISTCSQPWVSAGFMLFVFEPFGDGLRVEDAGAGFLVGGGALGAFLELVFLPDSARLAGFDDAVFKGLGCGGLAVAGCFLRLLPGVDSAGLVAGCFFLGAAFALVDVPAFVSVFEACVSVRTADFFTAVFGLEVRRTVFSGAAGAVF
jgi:hypothetical protein